jgi:PAS domain S-box-containing protein
MMNFTTRFFFLSRGERNIAPLGAAAAFVLVAALAAAGFWVEHLHRRSLRVDRQHHIETDCRLLALSVSEMLRTNQLTSVRRTVAEEAAKENLRVCRLTVGAGKVIADSDPAAINTAVMPDHWDLPAGETVAEPGLNEIAMRVPVAVPGRGSALLEVSATTQDAATGTEELWAGLGICGSIGLGSQLLVYRRSRRGLAEIDQLRGAVTALGDGETDCAALKLNPSAGRAAVSWNNLLDEVNQLRHRAVTDRAAAGGGGRRAQSGGLEAACDAMSQGLVLVDDQMKVRFSNGAACAFLHQDRNALTGKPAVDLISDEKFQESIRAIADGKLRRPVTVEMETSGEAGLGVLRFCIRPVRRGDADSAMIIVEDVTQQRAAERARNAFINQVTHELRTPLTNIRLYTETAIDDGDADPAVRAKCLNVINLECRRLERIVGEMLSVAEIEAGSCTIRREDVYFEALVEELKADYQAQAEEKRINLQFVLAPKLPKIQADRDKLAIALHNLIANALKYTPEGGSVTVTADVKDGQLIVDVTDTGIGIKPEEQDRIFDRFYRSADPRVGKIVGTGLGLTLAREVVRLHGGDVTLQSVLDKGSTFSAVIPMSALAA